MADASVDGDVLVENPVPGGDRGSGGVRLLGRRAFSGGGSSDVDGAVLTRGRRTSCTPDPPVSP
ncbi:hypothetical protein [Amycolatopsis ultiminotia]|uniref:hypothetical protein n=1 Tax=Amycolatopsis ultiminotia TaxID=543629 RepID=UPI0031E67B0A